MKSIDKIKTWILRETLVKKKLWNKICRAYEGMLRSKSIQTELSKCFSLTLIVSFVIIFSFFLSMEASAGDPSSRPDSQIEMALKDVFHSNGISYKTCMENIQILIRSALKRNAYLQNADVLIISSPGEFLRPKSLRWQQVPHYDFHVVLLKEGWIYDFASQDFFGKPQVLQVRDYLQNLFPLNSLTDLQFKIIPALNFLLPRHQKLPMNDKNTYDFIRKIWQEEGHHYKKLVFNNDRLMTLNELMKQNGTLKCSRLFSDY